MAPRKVEIPCQQSKFRGTVSINEQLEENLENAGVENQSDEPNKAREWIKKTCTTKLLKSRLPCLEWIPQYTLRKCFHDFIAGLTVALTAIPQGIAYGGIYFYSSKVKMIVFYLNNFFYGFYSGCGFTSGGI